MPDLRSLLPELYDLETRSFTDDIPFYERLARQTGGPVLELGVGTGRIAIALAAAGFEVWGIDTSDPMLERARSKAGPMADNGLHLLSADMRDFSLNQRFGLIYAGYGAFHHLLTPEDQRACLRCVQRHLAPDGFFSFDLRPCHTTDWQAGESVPVLHEWTESLPDAEDVVTKFVAVRPDPDAQIQRELHIYDFASAGGSLRRLTNQVELRFSTLDDLEQQLRACKLEPTDVYGGYDRDAYNDASEYLVIVARLSEGS